MQLVLRLAALAVALCGGALRAAALHDDDPYALPEGLLIGAGVSSIQTEGAWDVDGKSESVSDHTLHTGKLAALGFGDPHEHDVAADSYHRYKEDVKAAADLGLKLYRFSISWSRVLPDAKTKNEKGVQYYHDLIDEIRRYNMIPLVTLYHYDHPWILEEQFKGWQSEQMVPYFTAFAKVAFEEYASKVELWTTINEPNMYCTYFPMLFVQAGLYSQSDTDMYACMRNTILAHAEVYHLFQDAGYKGQVGFTAMLMTARPNSTLPEDAFATDAYNQVSAGQLLNPVVHGDYPQIVKDVVGSKLQPFSEAQKARIKGTSDFIGFNVYYGMVASYSTAPNPILAHLPIIGSFMQDLPFVNLNLLPGFDWMDMSRMLSSVEPEVIRSAMLWAWEQYQVPLIVTENGYADAANLGKNDHVRGVYHSAFLRTLVSTMKKYSVKVIGYCTWSLIDSFEWSTGYRRPFGLVHVDYEGGTLDRSMKDSSAFWTELAATKSVPLWEEPTTTTTLKPAPTPRPTPTAGPGPTPRPSPRPTPIPTPTARPAPTPSGSSTVVATSTTLLVLLALAPKVTRTMIY